MVVADSGEYYKSEDARLHSFLNNWSANSPVTPVSLARAGFFYKGPGDRVQCAYCGGRLYNWEVGDVSIQEHGRHFSNCAFVLRFQGNSWDNHRNKLPAVQIVKQLGYDDDVIRMVAQKYFDTSDKPPTVERLLDAIFEESKENYTEVYHKSATEKKCSTETIRLKEQLQIHKQKTQCKVCLDNEIVILFLPCRHLVCCENCSERLKKCPICRTEIRGTMKVYL